MAAILVVFGLLGVLSGGVALCWLVTRPLPPVRVAPAVIGWTLAGLALFVVGVLWPR